MLLPSHLVYWASGDESEQRAEDQILSLLPPSIPWNPGAEAPSGKSCWDQRATFSKPIGKIRKTLGFWDQPRLGRTPETKRSTYSSFLFPLCHFLSSHETFTQEVCVLREGGLVCVTLGLISILPCSPHCPCQKGSLGVLLTLSFIRHLGVLSADKRSLCEAAEFHGAQALSINTFFCSKIMSDFTSVFKR